MLNSGIESKNTQILLISDCDSNSYDIERRLLEMINFSCCIRRCSGLAESIEVFGTESHDFDVILMDMGLVGAGRPRKTFRKWVDDITCGVPIIVFNGPIEHDISLFLIEEGAADTVTRDQMGSDMDRLVRAIENSMIRNKAARKTRQRNEDKIAEIEAQAKIDLGIANSNGVAALEKAEEVHKRKLKEKEQVINWICGGYSVEK